MNNRLQSIPGWEGQVLPEAEESSPETQLRRLRNVTSSLMQEALKVWADLWGEMEGRVVSGVPVPPRARKEFKPQCGLPEFLEKMWLLRYYLHSAERFSQQQPTRAK